jgi:hypothetical protein
MNLPFSQPWLNDKLLLCDHLLQHLVRPNVVLSTIGSGCTSPDPVCPARPSPGPNRPRAQLSRQSPPAAPPPRTAMPRLAALLVLAGLAGPALAGFRSGLDGRVRSESAAPVPQVQHR